MTRDEQIRFMQGALQRRADLARALAASPAFQATLAKYDHHARRPPHDAARPARWGGEMWAAEGA